MVSKKKKDDLEDSAVDEQPDVRTQEAQECDGESTPERSPEERALEEAQQWKDKYLRQLADFDNFRKRMRQEMQQSSQYAREAMIISLLPIKDDFDRMFAADLAVDESLRQGAKLIYDKLNSFFESHAVTKMDGRGSTFDPEKHDALVTQPTADFPPGTILEVITPGYMQGDRVIRHAQVMVSSEPETESASGESSEDSDNEDGA